MLQSAHMPKHIAILGAGNMGTALAVCAAKHAPVVLWSVESDVIERITKRRENTKYLAGVRLPRTIRAVARIENAVEGAQLVIVAVPSHVVETVGRQMARHLSPNALVLNVAKGVDEASLAPMIDVVEDELPRANKKLLATLSGPSIATEFAAGLPTVVNVAAHDIRVARRVARLLETPSFRLRPTTDVAGTAFGGTLKNIYALALGMCDGAKLGANTKAALMTLAVEEMSRMMRALGARSNEAVHGFAGLGDLFVTGTSTHSRNRRFGEEICIDPSCRLKMQDPTQTIEGVRAVRALAPFAKKKKIAAPILFMVDRVLFAGADPGREIRKTISRI